MAERKISVHISTGKIKANIPAAEHNNPPAIHLAILSVVYFKLQTSRQTFNIDAKTIKTATNGENITFMSAIINPPPSYSLFSSESADVKIPPRLWFVKVLFDHDRRVVEFAIGQIAKPETQPRDDYQQNDPEKFLPILCFRKPKFH